MVATNLGKKAAPSCLPTMDMAFTGKVHHHTSLFLPLAMQVDIVIDETATVGTSSYAFSTFLSNFNISTANLAEYPFLAKQQVYGYTLPPQCHCRELFSHFVTASSGS